MQRPLQAQVGRCTVWAARQDGAHSAAECGELCAVGGCEADGGGHAYTMPMHVPCLCIYTMHIPRLCAYHAHTMHIPCTYTYAYAYAYHAYTFPIPCLYHACEAGGEGHALRPFVRVGDADQPLLAVDV